MKSPVDPTQEIPQSEIIDQSAGFTNVVDINKGRSGR
jgi:hypothetical protein